MMTKGSTFAFVCTLLSGVGAFSPELSRRQSFEAVVGGMATAVVPSLVSLLPANAVVDEETPRVVTRMGGLLESFQDGQRSIKMMIPSGWNKFDGEVGAFDLKWQDLVDNTENIKVSSTPVKSNSTSIALLGNVEDVGASLAAKRNAKLLAATERQTDGILFYKFDFAINDGTHQLLQLCICKGKLWSIDANASVSNAELLRFLLCWLISFQIIGSFKIFLTCLELQEKRWPKRSELYENVLGSFMPKLA